MEKAKPQRAVWFPELGTVIEQELFAPPQREECRLALARFGVFPGVGFVAGAAAMNGE